MMIHDCFDSCCKLTKFISIRPQPMRKKLPCFSVFSEKDIFSSPQSANMQLSLTIQSFSGKALCCFGNILYFCTRYEYD